METQELMTEKQREKLNKLLTKYIELEHEMNMSVEDYNEVRDITLKLFKTLGLDSYKVLTDSTSKEYSFSTFTRVKKTNINYDIDKLKQRLGGKTANKILNRSFFISDYNTFKKVMQKYKVPVKEIKDCISISESVNNSRLQRAFELGRIKLENIRDCYSISKNEYIMHKKTKTKE